MTKTLTRDETALLKKICEQNQISDYYEIKDDAIIDKEDNETLSLSEGVYQIFSSIIFGLMDWTDREEELFCKMCYKYSVDIS